VIGIQCASCERKHLFKNDSPTCDAFPKEIPSEILTGRFDHRKPYKGDNGLQWKVKKGFEYIEKELPDVRTDSLGGANPGGAERA
jgi:hypothetical protein